jgi:hypothetical protein
MRPAWHTRGAGEGMLRLGAMAAPPPLDITAVIAYCEQRVPPHALHQVHMEAVIDRHAVTLVERRARGVPSTGRSGPVAPSHACGGASAAATGRSTGPTATTAGTATSTRRPHLRSRRCSRRSTEIATGSSGADFRRFGAGSTTCVRRPAGSLRRASPGRRARWQQRPRSERLTSRRRRSLGCAAQLARSTGCGPCPARRARRGPRAHRQ